ncbi:MAG: hypothetical protein HY038_07965 [Nitrospirae bacterium]|nr:hypothetical protein [Nitrospirota bacterium]
MTTEHYQYLDGFKWAVPIAFLDALGACQFSRGDTLYSSSIAYQEWNDEFYKKAKGTHALKVLSPEVKPVSTSGNLFQLNWDEKAEVETYTIGEADSPKRQVTTQGRIYCLIWRGDLSILNVNTPPPEKLQMAADILKSLDSCHSTIRQHVLEKVPRAMSYFAFPHDLCSELLNNKYKNLVSGLHSTLDATMLSLTPDEISVPDSCRVAPTITLRVFAFGTENEDSISATLKAILYREPANKESSAGKFRLAAHGLFSRV